MNSTDNKKLTYLKWLFLAIAISSVGLVLFKFDYDILFFIKDNIRNGFLNKVVPFYTTLGDDGIIWIVLGLVLLIPKKTRKCVKILSVSMKTPATYWKV